MKKVIFPIVVVLFVTLAVGLSVAQLPFEIPDDGAPVIEYGYGNSGSFGGCERRSGSCVKVCHSCGLSYIGGSILGTGYINSGSQCRCGYIF